MMQGPHSGPKPDNRSGQGLYRKKSYQPNPDFASLHPGYMLHVSIQQGRVAADRCGIDSDGLFSGEA